jgi:ankyrin repeat protein
MKARSKDGKDYSDMRAAQQWYAEALQLCIDNNPSKLDAQLEDYLSQNTSITTQTLLEDFKSEGRTLIHVACSTGNVDVINLILTKAAEPQRLVKLADDNGYTALMNATISENIEAMRLVLSKKPEINFTNKDNASAIHFAAGDGSLDRVQLLIDHGADITLCSKSGSLLHWSAGKGHSDMVKFLLDIDSPKKIDINALNEDGVPAVMLAASVGSDDCTEMLVNKACTINGVYAGNVSLLHICSEHQMSKSIDAIVTQTPESTLKEMASLKTDYGNTPIELAAMTANVDIIKRLLPYSINDNDDSLKSDGSPVCKTVEDYMSAGPGLLDTWNAKKAEAEAKEKEAEDNDFYSVFKVPHPPAEKRVLEAVTAAANEDDIVLATQYKDKGNAHYKNKEFKEAIEQYTLAIQLQGDNATLWSNRSASYLSVRDPHNAILDAEICRSLRPDWIKGCFRLAQSRMALGQYEDAALAAFEGLKIDNLNKDLRKLTTDAVAKGKELHAWQQKQKEKKENAIKGKL